MVDIPIWRFGTRWAALENYAFHPEDNSLIPFPTEHRADQGSDLALTTLIPANLSIFVFLMILLSRNVEKSTFVRDLFRYAENFSILCYLVFIIFYSIYLAIYYREIWSSYYALSEQRPNDRTYFYLYAYFLAVFSMTTMFLNPLLWPLYVFVLFVALVFKKLRTMKLFCDAVDDYFMTVKVRSNVFDVLANRNHQRESIPMWIRQMISARALAISFTRNFIVWGGAFGLFSALALVFAFNEPILADGWLFSTHQFISAVLVALMVAFFVLKTGGGGIRRLKNQIENGEWEGFSLMRAPWS